MPRKNTINWVEIQKVYDDGYTISDICTMFNISLNGVAGARRRGDFKTRDKSNCQLSKINIVKKRIDELVEKFNLGCSWRDLLEMGFKQAEYNWAKNNGLLTPRSSSEGAKLARKKYGNPVMGAEARNSLSFRQSLNNTGGKSKWFEVSGQKVQGTWERDIAQKFDEMGIRWYKPKVNKDIWLYIIDGKTRAYTPDFYLPDYNLYLEVKGYWWGNDKEKMRIVLEQHSDKHIVIVEKEQYNSIMGGELVW